MSVFKGASNLAVFGGQFTAHQPVNVTHNHNHKAVELNRYTAPGKIHRGNVVGLLHNQSALAGLLDSEERFDAPKCDPDTRLGIIAALEDWVEAGDSSSSSSLLWLHGPAGVGKSALGQQIALQLKAKDIHAGSFFFSRTYVGRNNGNMLIATLAYQLAMNFPPVRAHVAKNLKKNPGVFSLSNKMKMQLLIVEPINALRKSWRYNVGNLLFPSRAQPRLVVIDGLDECDNPQIQCDILMVVAYAVQQLRMPFRFIIASRPEAHILSTLKHEIFRTINYTYRNLGEDAEAEHDVFTFLTKEFENIRNHHELAAHLPKNWPSSVDMDKLILKSSCGFIYPATVIKYIKSPHLRPDECLNVILGLSANALTDRPYAPLDDLYDYIFRNTHAAHAQSIKAIFDVLVIPRVDGDELGVFTTPDILEDLLSFPKGHVEHVLGYLLCLVSLHGREKPVKLLHASLSDFLLDPTRSGPFFTNVGLAHKSLASGYVNKILEHGIYMKELPSTYYALAARHSDEALEHGLPSLEAYASLDKLHEEILRSTPTIQTVIKALLSPRTDGEQSSETPLTVDMLQQKLSTQAHRDYVAHALDALPYLFDVKDDLVFGLQSSFLGYLLDESRSGCFSAAKLYFSRGGARSTV